MMSGAIVVLFAVRSLGMTPRLIGAALTAGNVGFLAGAPLASVIGRRLGVGPTLIGSAILIAIGPAFIPLAHASTAVPLVIAAVAIEGFGGVIYNVTARSLIQTITPRPMLGRTVATNRFVVWGTIPLGALLGGILGLHPGLRPTLWIAAAGGFLAFLPPLLSPVRKLREMPAPPKEPSE